MDINDAVKLLEPGVSNKIVGKWADLGAGEGFFTNALANLIAAGSIIYAVDSNSKALNKIQIDSTIELITIVANIEKDELPLHDLDGILMANALHFVRNKSAFIKKAQLYLKSEGKFVIVEYDTNTANRWVPYPISFTACHDFFSALGYTITKIGEQPSIYNNAGMYCALIHKGQTS